MLLNAQKGVIEKCDGDDEPVESNNSRSAPPPEPLTDEEVIANSYMFLFAGYDTTSTALAFVVHCLVKYPDHQELVYKEILSIVNEKVS